MTFLICYDITDNRLRLKIAKRLERAGCVRLQKSVFLAPHFEAKRMAILRGSILRLLPATLLPDESILVIPIERDNTADVVWAGSSVEVTLALQKLLFKLL